MLRCVCLPLAGEQLAVAEWDACLYIVRADLVLERAQQADRVRWMAFGKADSGFTCRWAKASEAQVYPFILQHPSR